ncbi:protein kinase [Nitrosomonas sp. Nm132]|uniref:protein kinase domain-containing protein n=1 Tax=Nitrosomonas sp. Nm132 TaxID=1881053 RepID=UPI00088D8DBE|nr:protein kinase [Nitrosomonas sp. Nm132]SDH57535.1 Serine/threonine protein kinase [Nitrosomonas sp. Nm132]
MTHTHDQILPKGTQLGVYEIKDTLKIGAFDITYHAWNHHLKERVDIQEYFPHDLAMRVNDGPGVEPKSLDDKENFEYGLKAFLDQAERLTQIEHPNIAVAENVLQLNGTAYLIMARQEGVSLSKVIQPPASLAETELKFILVSVLNALQKIHEYKIVHGGIQPAAIFLSKNGEPLLTHFAAARLAIAARTSQLADELAAGYAPVEQYEQANQSSPATDFYALGATMYYCMTHRQPDTAQSRIMALSSGEPDPMTLPTDSAGTPYTAEWLQAINWMLRPDYNDRPQSAAEILALLKPECTGEQGKAIIFQQKATDEAVRSSVDRHSIVAGVMAGIIALLAVGVWYGEKTSESLDDQSDTVAAQLPSEDRTDETFTMPEAPEDLSVALAITQSSQPESDQISENIPSPASTPVSEPIPEDVTITTDLESDKDLQLAATDSPLPQPKYQNVLDKTFDEVLIKSHLAAAEKAMRAARFTTPQRDSAFKYYQMVLAIDPGNADALSGLQRIVDRYVQFIAKASIEGRLDEARLYLQRAESVLPDDPKLHRIRAELAVAKE